MLTQLPLNGMKSATKGTNLPQKMLTVSGNLLTCQYVSMMIIGMDTNGSSQFRTGRCPTCSGRRRMEVCNLWPHRWTARERPAVWSRIDESVVGLRMWNSKLSPSKKSCLNRPDSGQLRFEDQDVTQFEDAQLAQLRSNKIGFFFQAFNLLPSETVVMNVEAPLLELGMGARVVHRKAIAALELVGLGKHLETLPSQLPARRRQYVAIARSLAHDPSVIFVDEPTRALDAASREEMMGMLQKLNEQGRTMVFATPDTSLGNYCRRVVRIAEGRVVRDELVSKRRIVPQANIPGPIDLESDLRGEEMVCLRCNYGNPKEDEVCQRCGFILQLTKEEERSIEGRLSGADKRLQGVESASDEGEVPGQDLVEELKEVSFLAGLGSKSLVKLTPALEHQRFPKGSTIVKQGGPADSFYIVRSGDVQVVLEREGRLASPIATLGAKEGFGEMALLTDKPDHSFTIIALSDVELWRLPKEEFKSLVSENLSLALYFNRLLIQRLSTLQEKVYL